MLVTGDVKYHEAQDALDLGLAIIDVGHYASEAGAIGALADYLRERLAADGHSAEVVVVTGRPRPLPGRVGGCPNRL